MLASVSQLSKKVGRVRQSSAGIIKHARTHTHKNTLMCALTEVHAFRSVPGLSCPFLVESESLNRSGPARGEHPQK